MGQGSGVSLIMNLDQLMENAVRSVQQGNCLGKGRDGIVYAVTDSVVLKLYRGNPADRKERHYHGSSKRSAEYEFRIGLDLRRRGVQVPKYFGLFKPGSPSLLTKISEIFFVPSPLTFWGVFMQRIHGVQYQNLPADLRQEARHQYHQQKELLAGLGYTCIESLLNHNALFDVDNKKFYFIDLVRWKIQ